MIVLLGFRKKKWPGLRLMQWVINGSFGVWCSCKFVDLNKCLCFLKPILSVLGFKSYQKPVAAFSPILNKQSKC